MPSVVLELKALRSSVMCSTYQLSQPLTFPLINGVVWGNKLLNLLSLSSPICIMGTIAITTASWEYYEDTNKKIKELSGSQRARDPEVSKRPMSIRWYSDATISFCGL